MSADQDAEQGLFTEQIAGRPVTPVDRKLLQITSVWVASAHFCVRF